MGGIVAPHEVSIGLLADRTGKHPAVEGGCLGLVDPVLGMPGAGKGKQRGRCGQRENKEDIRFMIVPKIAVTGSPAATVTRRGLPNSPLLLLTAFDFRFLPKK